MELRLETEIGVLTGIFDITPINCYSNVYTAWFKEKPHIIVQSDSINNAITELKTSLHVMLDYEKAKK